MWDGGIEGREIKCFNAATNILYNLKSPAISPNLELLNRDTKVNTCITLVL